MSREDIMNEGGFDSIFDHEPDRLIVLFADEMLEAGLQFPDYDFLTRLMPDEKEIILPAALKYYKRAKAERRDDAQNYFLAFFEYEELDEFVPMLVEDFLDPETWEVVRHSIAECIFSIGSDKYVPDYLRMIEDPTYGYARQPVLQLLGRLKDERAIPTLIALLDDDNACSHALVALSAYRREELRVHFERFLDSDNQAAKIWAAIAIERLDE